MDWQKQIHEALQIHRRACFLEDLSNSFRDVGNPLIADELRQTAKILRSTHATISLALSQHLDEELQKAKASTAETLRLALENAE